MAVDPETLRRARKLDRAAINNIFSDNYAVVHRIALGLTGRADVGGGVEQFVFKQAMRGVAGWKDEDAPERWFAHHTVLITRRAARHVPDGTEDTLIADPASVQPGYLAFVRTIRGLPIQQREAFLLHHGEQRNERFLAIAMDCSVMAATNHLNAANDVLQKLAGDQFGPFVQELSRNYRSQGPEQTLLPARIQRNVRRYIWPRRFARFVSWIFLLCFLVVLIYGVWKIWPMLEF